jgi:hypothetical protein
MNKPSFYGSNPKTNPKNSELTLDHPKIIPPIWVVDPHVTHQAIRRHAVDTPDEVSWRRGCRTTLIVIEAPAECISHHLPVAPNAQKVLVDAQIAGHVEPPQRGHGIEEVQVDGIDGIEVGSEEFDETHCLVCKRTRTQRGEPIEAEIDGEQVPEVAAKGAITNVRDFVERKADEGQMVAGRKGLVVDGGHARLEDVDTEESWELRANDGRDVCGVFEVDVDADDLVVCQAGWEDSCWVDLMG